MTCFVLGDSIGVGVAAALPACHADARVGVSSTGFVRTMLHHVSADLVVVSLGANDSPAGTGRATVPALRRVRAELAARRVVWLVPNVPGEVIRSAIRIVAAEHADMVLDTAPYAGGRLHPTASGYKRIGDIVSSE